MNVLSEALDFVAGACVENGFNQNTTLRTRLVIEELFTNSVHHGYQNNGGLIWLTVQIDDQRMLVGYQDEAPAYNPLAMNDETMQSIHANADRRPVGGLGAILIANLADSVSYHYQHGRNILELTFLDRNV